MENGDGDVIVEMKNPLLLPKVLELAKNIPDFPIGKFKAMLEEGFNSKDSRLTIYQKDDEIKGFIYATTDFFNGERVIFLQAASINNENRHIGHELLADLRRWAAIQSCDYIYMITKRDELKAFERKYKFAPVGTVMRREV